MISEHNTHYRSIVIERYFKGMTLAFRCDRATQHQTNLGVVTARREHQRRSASGLLVARLGAKFKPNEIAAIRLIHYQASLPAGLPQSVSS